jgi:hypothetical protein
LLAAAENSGEKGYPYWKFTVVEPAVRSAGFGTANPSRPSMDKINGTPFGTDDGGYEFTNTAVDPGRTVGAPATDEVAPYVGGDTHFPPSLHALLSVRVLELELITFTARHSSGHDVSGTALTVARTPARKDWVYALKA